MNITVANYAKDYILLSAMMLIVIYLLFETLLAWSRDVMIVCGISVRYFMMMNTFKLYNDMNSNELAMMAYYLFHQHDFSRKLFLNFKTSMKQKGIRIKVMRVDERKGFRP